MKIGIPRETRAGETRVAATPETVKKLIAGKNTVLVETGAGAGAHIPDAGLRRHAGAQVVSGADVYSQSEMLFKVRPPQADEVARDEKPARC